MPHKHKTNKNSTPPTPVAVIQNLIRISQSLLTLAEKETQALLTDDMLAFAIMQYEKEKLAADYTKASESFRLRLEEFRNTDPNLLARMEKLQRELAEKASGNNILVERIRKRAHSNAQKGLKMGQNTRIRFKDDIEATTAKGV